MTIEEKINLILDIIDVNSEGELINIKDAEEALNTLFKNNLYTAFYADSDAYNNFEEYLDDNEIILS